MNADAEYALQLFDATHDPAMRAGARELVQGYAERGYAILYLTARSAEIGLPDGRTLGYEGYLPESYNFLMACFTRDATVRDICRPPG